MNISKEAIEAAEKSLRDEGLDDVGNPPHGWRCEYPDLYPGYCTCVTDLARAALEAAAPLLMAQALRDSADDFKGEDLALDVILAGPDAVRHHLNSRADVMTRMPL